MTPAAQPAVLLLAADRRELRHWAAALAPVAVRVWQNLDEVPRDESLAAHPLVVVTDGSADLAHDPRLAFLAVAEVGVVRLGSGDSSELTESLARLADPAPTDGVTVALPVDVSARELALVCRLLGEIVALRRALRVGRDERTTLAEQALTDPLTRLPNRRAWDETLAMRVTQASEAHESFVVALFDLDHFKQVNDRGGHVLGDAVLRAAAAALRASIRRHDFAARLGGDEFGVFLAALAPTAAEDVLARIRGEIAQATREVTTPAVTASAGYVVVTAKQFSRLPAGAAGLLYRIADSALRAAKLAGRDCATAGPLAEL